MSQRILVLAMGLLWMTGCSAFQPVPDLGNLYNKLAQQEDPLRDPVIVISGILGSRLEDESIGEAVWSAFGSGAVDPHTGEGARLLALPMDPAFVDNILYFLLESPRKGSSHSTLNSS